jgi:hypothetical protein
MIATLLFLFAALDFSPDGAPLPIWAYGDVHACAASAAMVPAAASPALGASPAITPSPAITYQVFLPLVASQPSGCEPIPGVEYATLSVDGLPADRPAEQHADLNLALRGYEVTAAYLGLVEYGGSPDPAAPQLCTLFGDRRLPAFATAYRVYNWDWDCNCRGDLVTDYPVTLIGMGVTPGEVLRLPDSGYDIGSGYEALVLYATEERITLKYTREDNVVSGYTLHVENVCVEPSLLALYQAWNDAGRGRLPALRGGQPLGRAQGVEIGVAIRDNGAFMDPRSRWDWWRSK